MVRAPDPNPLTRPQADIRQVREVSGQGNQPVVAARRYRIGHACLSAPEDLRDLVCGRLLEAAATTIGGLLVIAPADEGRSVPEPIALQVVVRDLDDAPGAERLP